MTGPDLAALREKADRLAAIDACEWTFGDNETELMVDMTPQFRDECVEAMLAVLALVDEQRKALTRLRDYGALTDEFVRMTAEAALAGSPAANEITSAPWRGLEGWNVGVEFRGDDVVVMARAPGQSVWRDLLTVTR